MPRIAASLVALVLFAVAPAAPAHADKYDLRLQRLFDYDAVEKEWVGRFDNIAGQRIDQNKAFAQLMGDMGSALAPRFLGPGATTGALGFQIGVNFAISNIPENNSAWRSVMGPWGNEFDPRPNDITGAESYLQTMQFFVRKGLPFSAEVGGSVTKLFASDLWGIGLELKWAALEGFKFAPEIAFRGAISTFQGAKDYGLLVASGDAIISKKIGIAGLFKLAPYLGYNFVYIHGSSNVIAVPKAMVSKAQVDQLVFANANVYNHYIAFGFQVIATVVNAGFETSISPVDPDDHSFSFRLGVDF